MCVEVGNSSTGFSLFGTDCSAGALLPICVRHEGTGKCKILCAVESLADPGGRFRRAPPPRVLLYIFNVATLGVGALPYDVGAPCGKSWICH